MKEQTIAAIATGKGLGGVAIIRVSGEGAKALAKKIFVPALPMAARDWDKGYRLHYGHIRYGNETYDEVLLVLMNSGGSYTREEMVEIQCHGGVLVARRILELLFALGVREAKPGEFTKRAFLNGRLDLSQAEAVLETVAAVSPRDLSHTLTRLEGRGKGPLDEVEAALLGILARAEVAIDFPEDGIDEITADEMVKLVRETIARLDLEIEKARIGAIYREGIPTAILGRPNVGKSSLLNALLAEDRAIVTDIPGTTRDVIEAAVLLGDVPLLIMDTAGLRQAQDPVERLGLAKTHEAAAKSALILLVIAETFGEAERDVVAAYGTKEIIVLVNKDDLPLEEARRQELIDAISPLPHLFISAKERQNLEAIGGLVAQAFQLGKLKDETGWIGNRRHAEAFLRCRHHLEEVLAAKENQLPLDFLTIDLRFAIEALGEISGKGVGEALLDRIFQDFCIGK